MVAGDIQSTRQRKYFPKRMPHRNRIQENFLKSFIFFTTLPVASIARISFLDKSWYNLTLDSSNNITFYSVCVNVIDCIKTKIFLKASHLPRYSVSSFFLRFSLMLTDSYGHCQKSLFHEELHA